MTAPNPNKTGTFPNTPTQLQGWVKGKSRSARFAQPTLIGRMFPYMLLSELVQNLNLIAGRRVWSPQKLRNHLLDCRALEKLGAAAEKKWTPYVTSLDLLSTRAPIIYKTLILAVPAEEVTRTVGAIVPMGPADLQGKE